MSRRTAMQRERAALLRVRSWNVNGLRAAARKGFLGWLERSEADIVGVQEVRASREQLAESEALPTGWSSHVVAARRPGYSGVGLFSRLPADAIHTSLEEERFDGEGRLQLARFGRLLVANVYFPNGNGRERDNSRVPYKLDFYRALFELLQRRRRAGFRVLVMGDFNTAHREIDLARPAQNRGTSGFLAEEREELDRWLRAGWLDTYRCFDPSPGRYTWWSQRGRARADNVGWRIDYVLASPTVRPFLRAAQIEAEVRGSDHCPVGVDLDWAVLG